MKKTSRPRTAPQSCDEIGLYAESQTAEFQQLCESLRRLIDQAMPQAASKVWHGSPVWFLDDNPVVGYSVKKSGVQLLFWNGSALDEPELESVGKFRAAGKTITSVDELRPTVIRRWLKKARANVFDSRGFFKKLRESK